MSSVVTIVYNKFKTVEIKTTPSKTLKMLVQEMCQRVPELGDADRYGLKWKNTDLDLSLSMRLSRLPHGAKIELVPNKHLGAKVKVVLQLPTGDRIQKDVVNTATLKEIVCSLVELGQVYKTER
ncbi:Tether containing UBX domain for GLUT4 [Zancudomyces culisetae]|uniref:Tether containing UBX domain for GLUT4 n=1 Tax=Zancudomyces culisetae TaxID=1213189 RepID=A0A1R1PPA5_ZANCU|nr:Tether containing UBX domain for GLUT4 [Zancudomyces culisetae]|eukprot:OMH82771.1 Tether containing UBX domain for GLUT4 [Zancudomyces culisetae]